MKLVPDAVSRARFLMSKDKLLTLRSRNQWCVMPNPGDASIPDMGTRLRGKSCFRSGAIQPVLAIGPSCIVDTHDEFFDLAELPRVIDTLAFRDHNYVYVTPAEVGQARRVTVRQRVEAN